MSQDAGVSRFVPILRSFFDRSPKPAAPRNTDATPASDDSNFEFVMPGFGWSTVTRPQVYVMKDPASKVDGELHRKFGRYSKIRCFTSLYPFYAAIDAAAASKEDVALIVVDSTVPRLSFLTFLAHLGSCGIATTTEILYLGQESSLLFRNGRVAGRLADFPALRSKQLMEMVRHAIERFYVSSHDVTAPALVAV